MDPGGTRARGGVLHARRALTSRHNSISYRYNYPILFVAKLRAFAALSSKSGGPARGAHSLWRPAAGATARRARMDAPNGSPEPA
jgi:hypothetical protein